MTEQVQEAQITALQPAASAEVAPASMFALGTMKQGEFDARLEALQLMRARVKKIHLALMVEGEDYGEIPGTRKKQKDASGKDVDVIKLTLLKPGADKLCQFYGYVPSFVHQVTRGNGVETPHIMVQTTCRLHQGSQDGPIVGEGTGACSSWEKKYRYARGGALECPACKNTTLFVSKKPEQKGGFFCWAQKGGCGTNFKKGDPLLATVATEGDGQNPDPYDLLNTILKMSEKRAHVDATLRTTATSALYSQDLEDDEDDEDPKGKAPPPHPAQKPATSTTQPTAPRDPPPVEDVETRTKEALAKCTKESQVDSVLKHMNVAAPKGHPKRESCLALIEARRAELKSKAAA